MNDVIRGETRKLVYSIREVVRLTEALRESLIETDAPESQRILSRILYDKITDLNLRGGTLFTMVHAPSHEILQNKETGNS